MGQQLDLFTRKAALPLVAPAPPPPADEPPPVPSVLPGQIGLFDARSLALGRAHAAIAAGKLDEAVQELEELVPRFPDDADVADELAEAKALRQRLRRIEGPTVKHKTKAFLAFAGELADAPEPRASLRRSLFARAAAEIKSNGGDAGEHAGKLAGEYLVEAGDLAGAETSLEAAVAATGSAKAWTRLADLALLRGDADAARRRYRQALLVDPYDPALSTARDDDVRALPFVVRDEMEIDDEPEAWSAPAGMITGTLPRLAPGEEAPAMAGGMPAKRAEALGRARAFAEALAAAGTARGEEALAVRKRLKQASAPLFKAFMERVVRGRQ